MEAVEEIQRTILAAIREQTQAIQSSEKTIQEAQRTQQQLIEVYRRTLTDQWVGTEDFACESGMAISARSITDRIQDGRLEQGIHWINTSDGDRPTYLVCVRTVTEYFKKPPEKRRPAKRIAYKIDGT